MHKIRLNKKAIKSIYIVTLVLLIVTICFDVWFIYEMHTLSASTGNSQSNQYGVLAVLIAIVFFGIPAYIGTFIAGYLVFWSRKRLKRLDEKPGRKLQGSMSPSSNESKQDVQLTSQSKTEKTTKSIRILNLCLMLVAVLTIPLLGSIMWGVMMKQYRIPEIVRVAVAVIAYLVGLVLAFMGLGGVGNAAGNLNWLFFIPGILILLSPFLYTFFRPLPKSVV